MTTQTPLFSGSIVALVTPMDNHGNIDFETLEKLIEFHINAGTDSIVSVGTTGDLAPQFTLLNQDNQPISLSDFKGKKVLVYFYPKALTPGCTTQACGLRDVKSELEKFRCDYFRHQHRCAKKAGSIC